MPAKITKKLLWCVLSFSEIHIFLKPHNVFEPQGLTMFSWLDKRSLFSMALLCFSKRFRWVIVRCSSSSRFFCQRFSSCGQAKKLSAKSTKLHHSQTILADVWVFIAQLVQHCSTKTQRPWVRIPLGPKIFFGLIICNTLQVKPPLVVFSEEEKRRLSE